MTTLYSRHTTERGASSVEYAILVSLIAVVIIGGVALFGGDLRILFMDSCQSVAATQSSTC